MFYSGSSYGSCDARNQGDQYSHVAFTSLMQVPHARQGQLSIQQLLTYRPVRGNSGGHHPSNDCTVLIYAGPLCQTWTALYPEAAAYRILRDNSGGHF